MIIKKSLSIALFSTIVLLFSACHKDDIPTPRPDDTVTPSPVVEPAVLVAVLDSTIIEPEMLSDKICDDPMVATYAYWAPTIINPMRTLLRIVASTRIRHLDSLFESRVGVGPNGERRWEFRTYTFSYNSTTAAGQPVVLSARITLPCNSVGQPHALTSYSLFSHPMLFYNSWAPSNSMSTVDLRAVYNSAVISPDYQGLGIDNDINPVGFISLHSQTAQLRDCVKAAIELMRSRGITLDENVGHTTNWGCSECATTAMAFHRYYESDAPASLRNALRLSSTIAVEGPLTLPTSTRYADFHPDYDCFGNILITMMGCFSPEQLGGYQGEDFAPAWMSERYPNGSGSDASFIDYYSRLKAYDLSKVPADYDAVDIHSNVAPDMLNAEGYFDYSNPKTKAFFNVVDKYMTIDDFQPVLPLYIASAEKDEYILYEHARESYARMRNGSDGTTGNVHWFDVPTTNAVASIFTSHHLAAAIVSLFYMACVENPEDMSTYYTAKD